MYNIDELIEQTKNMPNVSDGGSECFSFKDVVLVKYKQPKKYGIARDQEEWVQKFVNEKNEMGVRTPKHLAIKREIIGEDSVCWVLQEKANGVSYTKYCNNKDNQVQLSKQEELSNMKDEYYQKLALDLKDLMYAGIELKPKNIFLDNSAENGGFTIIDLLGPQRDENDYLGSLKDFQLLFECMKAIFFQTTIYYNATDEEKSESNELKNKCLLKSFRALETAFPEFNKYRRFVLRTLEEDVMTYFKNNGINEDLTLTDNEEKEFLEYCQKIVDSCLDSLKSGKKEYWDISVNDARISISNLGMWQSFKYSKKNKFKQSDFEDSNDYEKELQVYLEKIILDKINRSIIDQVNSNSDVNENMLKAYKEICENNKNIGV